MVKERFPIRDIKGLTPAIDARNTDEVYLLKGRNYLFDSKGPKSGFGTRLLAGGEKIENEGGVCQSIRVGSRNFIYSSHSIWTYDRWTDSFTKVFDLEDNYVDKIDPWRKKWTAAYLSKGLYFAHYDYGLMKLENESLTPKDSDDIPGLPFGPIAVAESNARLLILGKQYLGFSSSADAENWEPTLGGAGQQLLAELIPGNPFALAATETGFVLWTDQDCLIGEFIGGDLVYRYDRMKTDQIPLNPWCVETFPDGTQLICTRQGIFRTSNGSVPEATTPIFNEFFREVLKRGDFIQVRIDYVIEQDLLYVQLRDWTNHYVRTYALSVALDKWGEFSERHLGVIRWSHERGAFGYVDDHGVPHKFVEHTRDREVEPDVYEGLDSEIEFGYVKPPRLHAEIDSLLEMHEIFLGSHPSRPSWSEPEEVNLGPMEVPEPLSFCLDFMTQTYHLNGEEVAIEDIFQSHWDASRIGENGYRIEPSDTSGPQSADVSPLTEMLELFDAEGGFTVLVEIYLEEGDFGALVPEGNVITLYQLGIETGGTIIQGIEPGGEADGVYLTQSTSGLFVSAGNTDLYMVPGLNRIAFTVSRSLENGDFQYAVAANGFGTVNESDFSENLFTETVEGGTAWGFIFGSANEFQGSPLSETTYFQRICIIPAITGAELQTLSETGDLDPVAPSDPVEGGNGNGNGDSDDEVDLNFAAEIYTIGGESQSAGVLFNEFLDITEGVGCNIGNGTTLNGLSALLDAVANLANSGDGATFYFEIGMDSQPTDGTIFVFESFEFALLGNLNLTLSFFPNDVMVGTSNSSGALIPESETADPAVHRIAVTINAPDGESGTIEQAAHNGTLVIDNTESLMTFTEGLSLLFGNSVGGFDELDVSMVLARFRVIPGVTGADLAALTDI